MHPSHTGGSNTIDYTRKEFEWTKGLKAKSKEVFGIADFRLCQEGLSIVQAVKITGTTSKQESREITQRLIALAGRNVVSRNDEIKLCYVTPEKIAKSKTFVSLLQKLDAGQQL
ncbi:hypothetical protein C0992_012567, partial [Termitomyces sp. T32_za158]